MKSYYISTRKQFFLLLSVLLFFPFSINIFAQNTDSMEYVIAEVTTTVDGITRENLIENYLEIKIGKGFSNLQELKDYLLDKQVYLNNNRIFAEASVSINRVEEQNEGPDKVYVDIWAKDTWNIIALPYFKYDSNDGLLLSIRGRDYNFLGSMERLALNLDYRYTEDSNNLFSLNGEFSLPFVMWERDWVFDINYNTEYEETTDETYPLYFNMDTDLGYYFTLANNRWRFNISNEYSINDRHTDDEIGEEVIPDNFYMTSGLSVGGPIDTGFSVGQHDLTWNPKLSTYVSYVPFGSISEDRQGIISSFSHSLKFGRVDWEGNFREGYSLSLSNSNTYNFRTAVITPIVEFNTQYFTTWGWGGINSRLKGYYRFEGASDNVGGSLRGILDSRIDNAEAGAYLNIDFPFNMWIWFMSRWFEGHLSPFVDVAMFHYSKDELDTNPFWYSAGIEAFAFPKFARSFYLRISAGIDMEAFLEDFRLTGAAPRDDNSRIELFFGLGHHY